MTWGVAFLQNGYGVPRGQGADIIALVPLGWVVGCPLVGFVSDRLGCRKPVLLGGAFAMLIAQCAILYLNPGSIQFAGWSLVFFILGVTSGTAMLPYTIIKEANSEQVKGSALGALGFVNFSCSAVLAPVFGWLLLHVSGERRADSLTRIDFQIGLTPLLIGIVLAITASLWIKETGAQQYRVRGARAPRVLSPSGYRQRR
jgi:MFS family permease